MKNDNKKIIFNKKNKIMLTINRSGERFLNKKKT